MVESVDPLESAPRHLPVMMAPVLEYLSPHPGQVIVDGTVGAGGHASEIARRLGSTGQLICLDRDPSMLELARNRIGGSPGLPRLVWFEASFAELRSILDELNLAAVDAVLLDLGVSSDQLDDANRGFSFKRSGPLDMRMNQGSGVTAGTLINQESEQDLANIFYEFGEERHSRRIARAIATARRTAPIETTEQLAQIVRRATPRSRDWHRIDPATRVFQALRIAVNDELAVLEHGLVNLPSCIKPGGRAVVISFHSLEDRLVKRTFRGDRWDALTRKPLTASELEVNDNPRARSAKLRAASVRTERGTIK